MLYKEAVSKRILELCYERDISTNYLGESSNIPPTTLYDIVNCKVSNPSSYVIYQLCKKLGIKLKEFYDSPLFDYENITD